MPTTFEVIFLGTAVDLDPTEGNTTSENLAALVGTTFGGAGSPLYDNIGTWAPVGSPGPTYEINNNPDQFSVNGTTYRYDGGGAFNATITYADGTTATVVVKIAQSTTGELFLTPETAGQEANQALLSAKPILSLTITSAQASTPGMAADRLAGNFIGAVDGTGGNDTMWIGYTDADGDAVTDNADVIRSGDGNDSVFGGDGDDVMFGGTGNDTLDGWSGNDVVYGGAGDDTLMPGLGADTLHGDAGNDLIQIWDNSGSVSTTGGDGFDTLDFRNWQSATGATVTFNPDGSGSFTHFNGATSGTFQGFEGVTGTANADTMNASATNSGVSLAGEEGNDSLTGGSGNDTLQGDAGDDTIAGGSGNDRLLGGAGNDTLNGGTGADTLDGGDGNDLLISDGTDANDVPNTLLGGAGNDTIRIGGGFNGNDSVDGGTGVDTLELLPADNRNLTVDMTVGNVVDGTVGTHLFTGIENVTTGGGNDTIIGTAGANALTGGAGNDSIAGGDGNDTLFGGAGNDRLAGGAGNDTVQGGDGADIVTVTRGDGTDTVLGGEGGTDRDTLHLVDTAFGGTGATITYTGAEAGSFSFDSGNGTFQEIEVVRGSESADTFQGSAATSGFEAYGEGGSDVMQGGSGDDTLFGGTGGDTLEGGAGNDSLDGGHDNDILRGEAGNDTLFGGLGNDSLIGGDGDDRLTGGSGNDSFQFARTGGADVVTDFSLADTDGDGRFDDQLDVSALRTLSGDPVTAWDVTVTDDGNGNALLTFPEGETIVLQGVAPSQMQTAQQKFAAGIPCFAAGTLILTPRGEIRIELLRPGDLVLTRDNGPQPLVWIGMRRLDAADLSLRPDLRPVVFAPGALGQDRRLLVSPQHGMLVGQGADEALVRAIHLARLPGGKVRIARGVRSVTYVHLMFDRHQVIWGNGLASESFYPGPWGLSALDPSALREIARLFPDAVRLGAAAGYGALARRSLGLADLHRAALFGGAWSLSDPLPRQQGPDDHPSRAERGEGG